MTLTMVPVPWVPCECLQLMLMATQFLFFNVFFSSNFNIIQSGVRMQIWGTDVPIWNDGTEWH